MTWMCLFSTRSDPDPLVGRLSESRFKLIRHRSPLPSIPPAIVLVDGLDQEELFWASRINEASDRWPGVPVVLVVAFERGVAEALTRMEAGGDLQVVWADDLSRLEGLVARAEVQELRRSVFAMIRAWCGCAGALGGGAFRRWVDVVFAYQAELGQRSWGWYAERAAVSDTARITRCLSRGTASPMTNRIREGLDFGREIGIEWTPMVLINGWYHPRPPTTSDFFELIDSLAVR